MTLRYLFAAALMVCAASFVKAGVKDGKIYRISPQTDNSRSLFVKDASLDEKAPVVMWTETDVPAQKWAVVRNPGGSYSLRNLYTGKYLSRTVREDGAVIICQTEKNDTSAQWTLKKKSGGYVIKSNKSKAAPFLDNMVSEDGGVPMIIAADSHNMPIVWKFTETSGTAELTAAVRKRVMDGWLKHFLQKRDNNHTTFSRGSWGEAEMMETLLDAYETSGEKEYLDIFKSTFDCFLGNVGDDWLHLVENRKYKWYGHDFNDDVMWMILASVRAYSLTGTEMYLTLAKKNFDAIYTRAYNQWGMMRWAEKSGHKNGTNSCINGPTEVAACYLAKALGDEKYYETARALYAMQRKYLFNPETGHVEDAFVWDEENNTPVRYNHWASTYNQGTMLGAALMLWERYGDDMYKTDAERIMQYTVQHLCNSHGIVKACQVIEGDLCGFKGILMRYVRRYAQDMHSEMAEHWLRKNALHAFNNMNSQNIISSAWLTKSAEDFKLGDKSFFSQPFGCSTAVSAAFNAPISK